jgi:hypothetical protein
MSADLGHSADPDSAARSPRRVTIGGLLILIAVAVFLVFWTWALFFASKEALNKIEDQAWTQRAEAICIAARAEREALADFRVIDPSDRELLRERGDLIDRSTDVLERMLDDVTAVAPTGPKGAAIVPDWEFEYRQYLQNRRVYAQEVRGGSNDIFRETEAGGVPVSERLSTFAGDNEMSSCSPPRDL